MRCTLQKSRFISVQNRAEKLWSREVGIALCAPCPPGEERLSRVQRDLESRMTCSRDIGDLFIPI